jgi:23S rRNA pseudouridine1911/1915/1917 synthase
MEGILVMNNILYEDNHIIVVEKKINVPVCEDESRDEDLLNIIKKYIKEKYNKPGNVYLGLVHRLDRPVGGVMVFAKTSKAASRLSEQVRLNKLHKEYLAVLDNDKINLEGTFKDNLLKDPKTNIVKVDKSGKEAILNYKVIDKKDNKTLVKVNLITGRSHQIRVQFSHHGYPLFGDQKYNKNAKVGEQIALFAHALTFEHPTTKEMMCFEAKMPGRYPFSIFEK